MKPLAQNTLIQNRYLIVQLIGKGGMGEVYLAVDQRLGSAIALKRTFFAGDEELGSAFEREARVLARMRHPVLPKVSDHFGEGDEQFLVMEHISGDDLSKRIETAQKPFPVSWVMFWADQLLDALSYLHSHEPPIIHRDIKPQNLKLTDENHIVLLDFGLSKSSTGQTNLGSSGSGSSTGSVVGYTPHYAPMEQIRGVGTSARSDIYALSATLYQLLSNTVPSDALSRADSMLNGLEDPVQPLYELNQEIPKSISDVIAQGMEVSQEKRFETAREMQRALRKAYSEMQNAMSAKTVVISGSDMVSNVGNSSTGSGTAAPAEPAEALAPDFGATLVLDEFPKASPEEPQQSGVKTEVFIPGAVAYTPEPDSYTAEAPMDVEPEYGVEAEPALPDFGMTNVYSSEGQGVSDEGDEQAFEPNATVPVIAFDPASAGFANEFEQDVSSDGVSQGFAGESQAASVAAPSASTAPKKKKGGAGKALGILAVLALLFVLGLGAVGGVWYYMAYIREESSTTPTPTPEETPAETPEPSPTADIAVPSPTETPEPTPEETPTPDPAPTQRQPQEPRSTPVRTPRPPPTRTPAPVRTPLPRRTPLP